MARENVICNGNKQSVGRRHTCINVRTSSDVQISNLESNFTAKSEIVNDEIANHISNPNNNKLGKMCCDCRMADI